MSQRILFTSCLLAAFLPSVVSGGTLIVLNKSEASASLIDDRTGEVVATVPTGYAPHEVAVSPDGRLAVGTNYGDREAPGSTLTVINIPEANVVKTISTGDYRRPHGIRWLPDGRHIVVTAEANHALLTLDVDQGAVVSAVETGQEVSHMVAITPDGRRAFVANIGSGSVTVVDLEKRTKLGDIVTGDGTEGIAVTPDGRNVWVTNRAADTVSVIDASSLRVVETLESKAFPIRTQITPDGRFALVSNAESGDLAVFDTRRLREVRRLAFQTEAVTTAGRVFGDQFGGSSVPIGIVIRPDGKRAYVAHTNADHISVIDLESWRVTDKWTSGKEPDGMDYSRLNVIR